jgi:hypothetical protein
MQICNTKSARRIFGQKKRKVKGSWRKMYDKFHNLYPHQIIIRMTKSRRQMRHVGYMKIMR